MLKQNESCFILVQPRNKFKPVSKLCPLSRLHFADSGSETATPKFRDKGSGGGLIGRAVASDTRDLRFESQHRQNFINQSYI